MTNNIIHPYKLFIQDFMMTRTELGYNPTWAFDAGNNNNYDYIFCLSYHLLKSSLFKIIIFVDFFVNFSLQGNGGDAEQRA